MLRRPLSALALVLAPYASSAESEDWSGLSDGTKVVLKSAIELNLTSRELVDWINNRYVPLRHGTRWRKIRDYDEYDLLFTPLERHSLSFFFLFEGFAVFLQQPDARQFDCPIPSSHIAAITAVMHAVEEGRQIVAAESIRNVNVLHSTEGAWSVSFHCRVPYSEDAARVIVEASTHGNGHGPWRLSRLIIPKKGEDSPKGGYVVYDRAGLEKARQLLAREGVARSYWALVKAARSRRLNLVRALLTSGVSPNPPLFGPTAADMPPGDSTPPLTTFTIAGNAEMVAVCLQHGADVDACDPISGRTALRVAVDNGQEIIARLLRRWGALEAYD